MTPHRPASPPGSPPALPQGTRRGALPFELLFDKAPFGLFVVNEHFRVVDCNEAFLAMAGADRLSVLGFDLLNAADQTLIPHLRRALDGVGVDFESRYTSTTGRRTSDYRYIFHPMQDEQGHRSALCFVEEISARKQAERALKESRDQLETKVQQRTAELAAAEARFRGLVEQSLAGFYIFDEERITYANPEMARMLGYASAAELQERSILDCVVPADRARVQDNIRRRLHGNVQDLRYRYGALRCDGQTLHVETHGRTTVIGGTRCIIGVMVDITAQMQEDARRQQRERLHHNALVREVHHRIKNHLQGVAGLLDVHAEGHPALAHVLADAKRQVQAIAVVHGLHAADAAGHLDLAALIRAVCKNQEQTSRCCIEGQTEGAPREGMALNPDKTIAIALTLNELIQNAIKHSPSVAADVRVQWRSTAQGALITVSNPLSHERAAPHIDLVRGIGLGTGLEIIRSLLPHQGAHLHYRQEADCLLAELTLGAPVMRWPAPPPHATHPDTPHTLEP